MPHIPSPKEAAEKALRRAVEELDALLDQLSGDADESSLSDAEQDAALDLWSEVHQAYQDVERVLAQVRRLPEPVTP